MKIDKPDAIDRYETNDDEKKRVLDLYDMELPVPVAGIFDEPTRCYRINQEWAAIVMGLVTWLTEIASWKGANDETFTAIQEISKFLQGEVCEVATQIRQSPLNSCQLEYSVDGGETWLLGFDYSLCEPAYAQTIIQQNTVNNFGDTVNAFTENIYNSYVNNYVNSITDIAPELGYGDADDTYRDDALCAALGAFIDSVSDSAIAYFDDIDDTANDLRVTLALAAAVIGIVALAASGVGTPAALALAAQAGLWAAGIGLGSALGGELVDHFTETNRAAYEDLQAREDVVCCLLNGLSGANVDKDDFTGAFGCGGLSTNAQAIHDAAALLAAEDAYYASFVENMRIGLNSAKLGLLPACPCDPTEWCYEFDLTQWYLHDWSSLGGVQTVGQLNGTQWDTTVLNLSTHLVTGIGIEIDMVALIGELANMTRYEVHFSAAQGTGVLGTDYAGNFLELASNRSVLFQSLTHGATQPSFNQNSIWNLPRTINPSTRYLQYDMSVDDVSSGGTPTGSGNVTKIRIYGTGTPPSFAGNC